MRLTGPAQTGRAAVVAVALLAVSGCGAIKTAAIKSVADTLSTGSGDVFTRDDDPLLVRDAVPFGLKTFESLLETVPRYIPLLTATCSNFTQYAYAFVQADIDGLDPTDYETITAHEERAFKLYLRARGYCMRALEERRAGTVRELRLNPESALRWAKRADVPLLYWTGASWGSAVSLGLDRPELVADLPVVRALMARALELDEGFSGGAIHAAMITLDARAEWGGSAARARAHFDRAVKLSKGLDPGPYVTLAMSVSKPERKRAEFVELLEKALTIKPADNPRNQLVILITQQRARRLLERVDDLFPTPIRGTSMTRVLIIGLLLALASVVPAAQSPIRLQLATMAPAGSVWESQLRKMATEWQKSGRVRIEIFPNGSLGPEDEVADTIRRPRPTPQIAALSAIGLSQIDPHSTSSERRSSSSPTTS